MPEAGKDAVIAAGVDAPEHARGITGLVPFEIVTAPPVTLREAPGVLRVWLDLPMGTVLHPAKPVTYRIFGGEAGLEFARNGQIVQLHDVRMPLEFPYNPRVFPTPPARGQLCLDLAFWYDRAGTLGIQDVQWRQVVAWDRSGAEVDELRFTL